MNYLLLQTPINDSSIILHSFFAYSFIPVKLIIIHGSSPTTNALCPGGITAVSPGPPSTLVPSSILTFILPEIMYDVCGVWQLFVLTSGLTHYSQLHPGSNVPLPIVTPLSEKFTISILPFSNVLTSSGEAKLFANIFADDIDHRKMVLILKGLRSLYLSSKECLLIQMCNIV